MRHRHVQDLRQKIALRIKEGKVLIETKKLALRIAAFVKSKKAQRVVVLDMQGVSSFCDYFVILSGESLRQVSSFAQGIEEDLAKIKIRPLSRVSPTDESGWVVLDYISVVVHIFYKPMREFYSLERLWSDARRVRVPSKIPISK